MLTHHRLPWMALLLSAGLLHCEGSGAARGSSHTAAAGSAEAAASAQPDGAAGLRSARRPERRYVLAHGDEQCIVYWEEDERRSEPMPVRCPRELQAGERIRLTGRVCHREGGGRERDLPVRCPAQLVARELADRRDAGL